VITVAAAVDLSAVVDIKDVDNVAVLVDPVNDAVGAALGPVAWPSRREGRSPTGPGGLSFLIAMRFWRVNTNAGWRHTGYGEQVIFVLI
jgi:hypothetical protein